ncbi:MAG: glycine betaine ABC transporter substrate-binding protein [Planctomycetota bacterium]
MNPLRCVSLTVASVLVLAATTTRAQELVVGSKQFTESVILGDIATQLLRDATDVPVTHQRQLGGSQVLFQGLQRGDLDAYPEYTGTIRYELLAGTDPDPAASLEDLLRPLGLGIVGPIGFNNTYALGLTREAAERLNAHTISDLRNHPELALRFSNEFMDRADGWNALRDAYQLPQTDVRGIEHALAYVALANGQIDATDLYSTDAEIAEYDLAVLEDDLQHFPRYDAVLLYRLDLDDRAPGAIAALQRFAGAIDEASMIAMNRRGKVERVPTQVVARDWLSTNLDVNAEIRVDSAFSRVLRHLIEHTQMVAVSLLAAIALAVPLGVVAARRRVLGQGILGVVGILQTVPAIAMLVFMIPLLGLGFMPAVAALFLYSLLPVVRNTHAGLVGIPQSVRDSAEALGLPRGARLRRIELPLAGRSILAGVKTAAVINVGTATLGAFIGAGGLGQPIVTGLRLQDTGLILLGALPAAGLAIVVQLLFDGLERLVTPRGLRGQQHK